MHITEQQIAGILDYSRFEPSDGMKEIISSFAEKFKLNQAAAKREKVSFGELSGEKSTKIFKQPVRDGPQKQSDMKNRKKL